MAVRPANRGPFQREQNVRLVITQETAQRPQVRDAMKLFRGRAAERHQPFRRADVFGQRRDIAEEFLDDVLCDCGLCRHCSSSGPGGRELVNAQGQSCATLLPPMHECQREYSLSENFSKEYLQIFLTECVPVY